MLADDEWWGKNSQAYAAACCTRMRVATGVRIHEFVQPCVEIAHHHSVLFLWRCFFLASSSLFVLVVFVLVVLLLLLSVFASAAASLLSRRATTNNSVERPVVPTRRTQ